MTRWRLAGAGVVMLLGLSACADTQELVVETVSAGDFRLTVGVRHLVCDSEPILQVREEDGEILLRARRATRNCTAEERLTEFELDFSEPLAERTVRVTQPEGVTTCPVAELVTVICD